MDLDNSTWGRSSYGSDGAGVELHCFFRRASQPALVIQAGLS